jgi:hypothetical protein
VNHPDPHPLAGQTVKLPPDTKGPQGNPVGDALCEVEDWADRVFGRSWMVMEANPTALIYAVRSAVAGFPTDDDVLYTHVGGLAFLVHASEIETSRAIAETVEADR